MVIKNSLKRYAHGHRDGYKGGIGSAVDYTQPADDGHDCQGQAGSDRSAQQPLEQAAFDQPVRPGYPEIGYRICHGNQRNCESDIGTNGNEPKMTGILVAKALP